MSVLSVNTEMRKTLTISGFSISWTICHVLSLLFALYILVETLFVVLQVTMQIELELGFGFPKPNSAHLGSYH